MGLKQRMKINNASKTVPKYALGKEWSWNGDDKVDGFKQRLTKNVGGIATSAIDFTGGIMNSFGPVKSEQQLMGEAGTTTGYGSGFNYQRQNNINQSQQLSDLSKENTANTLQTAGKGAALGATVGSIFPGLGTVIGGVAGGLIGGVIGLFGGASRRRKLVQRMQAAQRQVESNNNFGLSSAQTDYLANQYNLEHENTQDDKLFMAKHGKDLMQPIKK